MSSTGTERDEREAREEREAGAGLRARTTGERLPLAGVSVEAEIRDGSVRTVVSQRYVNRGEKPVEAVYTFPLDEGAAVCGFEAVVGGRTFRGEVEEREKAFEKYDDAMAAGDGAFLLDEERADVFTMSVGNLPPGGEALLRITTVAEAPREGDGIRWLLPTTVSPRYAPAEDRKGVGRTPAEAVNPPVALSVPYELDLVVRLEMSSAIRSVESPSHPIAVQIVEMDGHRGTVRLGERTTALDRDFVLLVREAEPGGAKVVVEKGERGEAVKIVFPPLATAGEGAAPGEVIFLVDRSGSMGGTSIAEARNALQLSLRSLPAGLLFNVAGFGSTFETLFPRSRPYDDATLAEASRHVASMDADLGGTEILPALEAVLKGEPPAGGRVLFLLTDGEVSNSDAVVALVGAHAAAARVFTFGIGAGASLALVRGVARAGRGACELIAPGERIEAKVVRQLSRALKGALAEPALDWGGLSVRQAPGRIDSLFAGERTSVYALVDGLKPATVTLSARSRDGRAVSSSVRVDPAAAGEGTLVATLAARGLVRDLEEGAWARSGSRQDRGGKDRVKEKIVALAKEFGIASRETSFVVVEEKKDKVTGDVQMVRVPVALTRGWGAHEERMDIATGLRSPSPCPPPAAAPAPSAAMPPSAKEYTASRSSGPAEARRGIAGMVRDGISAFFSDAAPAPPEQAEAPSSAVRHFDRVSTPSKYMRAKLAEAPSSAERPLDRLVALQRADGSWDLDERLAAVLGETLRDLEKGLVGSPGDPAVARGLLATKLALDFLSKKCAAEGDEWFLLAEKARAWLASHGSGAAG